MIKTSRAKPRISVVIPVEHETKYLKEALSHYSKQSYKNFDVIVSTTKPIELSYKFATVYVNKRLSGDASLKRNVIIKKGKGDIFVFNDDDVYVPKHYLRNVARVFQNEDTIAAAGPLLTPAKDAFMQQASGVVWESYLGSVGAGVYRSRVMSSREVFDYPAANLIVRRGVFEKVGGYERGIYPGEDTKLLVDIYGITGKGAIYSPKLVAYHHRKPLFSKHLQQIGRYGFQRGQFSLAYPTTSFKIQYFLPAVLVLYEIAILLYVVFASPVYNMTIMKLVLAPIALYLLLLLTETCYIVYRHGVLLGLTGSLGILATHIFYGYKFIIGFTFRIFRRIRTMLKHIS